MSVNAFLSEPKQFFIDSFSDPVHQDGVLYLIIEELPNPRDSGIYKILCGSTQIALDTVTLHAATICKELAMQITIPLMSIGRRADQ